MTAALHHATHITYAEYISDYYVTMKVIRDYTQYADNGTPSNF